LLAESLRGRAQKVLMVLTDGCQNHLWLGAKAEKCACDGEKACALNATCVGDISKWYNWVMTYVPGTRIIAVGVGDATTICKDQLLLAAGSDPLNVYNPQDWSQLLSLVETITATACTADNVPCPGCCGICTCGQCIAPTACRNPDACNTGVLVDGCCTTEEVLCETLPCKFGFCDDVAGCVYDDIKCQSDTECIHWECVDSAVCDGTPILDANGNPPAACGGTVIHQCEAPADCDDGLVCTIDDCVNFKCTWTDIVCTGDNDFCATTTCKPSKGCTTDRKTNCDDKNICTADSCNPTKGCEFIEIPCPALEDPDCFYSICDPIDGCATLPKDCAAEGFKAENCTVPACNETCYSQYICAAPPPASDEGIPDEVILVSTLTTAAVAGIVIAAVLLAAGLGGGAAVAIAQVAAGGGAVVTASNPLYAGSGIGGDNPLNQM
jgi:hypothetical protein